VNPLIIEYPLGDNPPKATLYYGDNVLDTLRRLPDKSVQMVATSPPYWGLRSYMPSGTMMLRSDLTPEEIEYVLQELKAAGVSADTPR